MKAAVKSGLRVHDHSQVGQGGKYFPSSHSLQKSLFANTWRKALGAHCVDTFYLRIASSVKQWRGVAWSKKLGIYAMVAIDGDVQISGDGITWIAQVAAAASGWHAICWADELEKFVAVASSGAGNRVMYSSDGVTWTGAAAAQANQWRHVCYSPKLNLFVATSIDGVNRVMTSPDGINWTVRVAAEANEWQGVCWSERLSLFVAVAQTGVNRVMTSPDGINWTARAAAAANQWESVAWSDDLTLFAAVSLDGANRVMTSPDGINWTSRAAAHVAQWYGLTYANEIKMFIATALDSANQAMTSPDGTNWTSRTLPSATQWAGDPAWSGETGTVVIPAMNGDVATSNILADGFVKKHKLFAAFGPAAGQYGDLLSIALPSGVWDITVHACYQSVGGATTTTVIFAGLGITAGNNGNDLNFGENLACANKTVTSGSFESITLPDIRRVVPNDGAGDRTINYYLKIRADTSTANLQIAGSITAKRVS